MEIPETKPYREAFPKGTGVRIADRAFLEFFLKEWNYHHKLTPDMLEYADRESKVVRVLFYHGGDVIYELDDVPGSWLEPCLRKSQESK